MPPPEPSSPPTSAPGRPKPPGGADGITRWFNGVPRNVKIVGGVVIVVGGYMWYRRYRAAKEENAASMSELGNVQYDYAMPPGGSGGSGGGSGVGDSDVTPVWLTNLSDAIMGALGEQNRTLSEFVQNQSSEPGSNTEYSTAARIRDLFTRYGVPIASSAETEEQRLARIVREVESGRSLSNVEASVRYIAGKQPGGTTGPGTTTQPSTGTYSTTDRIRDLFTRYGVTIASAGETEAQRLARITREVEGGRSLSSVESSVRYIAANN